MSGREKEIVPHLTEEDLDRLLNETDNVKIHERFVFIKRLYKGATLVEAADDIGKSEGTADNWVERWNEDGFGKLTPNFGGGQPPKLNENQQDELIERLREGHPWKKQEIQHLLNAEFTVENHPTFLSDLGLSYAIPRTKRPDRPDNAEEILVERVEYAFDESDTDEQPHNKRDGDDDEEE